MTQEAIQLQATLRTPEGKRVRQLRRRGHLPGILYGRGIPSTALSLELLPFQKVYRSAGESTLLDLVLDGRAPVKVLIHDVSFDPVSGALMHVDFYQVKMTEKITAEVHLNFVGESPAVKELAGVLVKKMDKVKIECLPSDLLQTITVPIDSLKTFDDFVYVRDLAVPPSVKILAPLNDIVVTAIPPRAEEEAPAAGTESKEDLEKIKVVGKKPEGEAEAGEEKKGAPAAGEKSAKSAQGGSGGKEKKEKK